MAARYQYVTASVQRAIASRFVELI